METKDMIDNEKKTYTTPELMEHGDFKKITQYGNTGIGDLQNASDAGAAPIPF